MSEFCTGLSLRSGNKELTNTAKGKIRYVGGYVIAKLHYRNSVQVQASAYKTASKDIDKYEHGKRNLQILTCLKTNESSLLESEYLGSLQETKRKQNVNRGLTNIKDNTYMFFDLLIYSILKLLSGRNVSIQGQETYRYVKDIISKDQQVFYAFVDLCTPKNVHQNISVNLEESEVVAVSDLHVQVCLSEIVSTGSD